MDQIITLDKDDDILQVHARVEWSDGRRVILVVPRGCKALDAEHKLWLLRRWADEADVQVALISTEYKLKELAKATALPVFSSVEKATRATRWKWPRNVSRMTRGVYASLGDEGEPRPRRPLLNRLGLAGWRLLLTIVLFGTAALLLATVAYFLVPSASITVVPKSIVISDSAEVILDPTVTTIDHINAIIPAGNYRREISGTMTISTTKTATAPADHATGEVIFTNLQGTETTIPLGTIVATTSGVTQRYSTTVTVTLPSGFNARVAAPVRALKPGPEANVPPLQVNLIEGPLAAVARVINVAPIGGGTIKEVKIVSFDDRNLLRQRLLAELRKQALAVLQAGAEENVYVVPASAEVIVLSETFDHPVDDPSDTLSLRIDAVASGIYAAYDDFEKFAERRLLSKLPPGYRVLPGTLRVEADPNARVEANAVILRVRSALAATPIVEKDKLLAGIYGKTRREGEALIAQRLQFAEPPRIRITPAWWPRFPFFDFRIALFVIPEGR